jgi:hypothetical protein
MSKTFLRTSLLKPLKQQIEVAAIGPGRRVRLFARSATAMEIRIGCKRSRDLETECKARNDRILAYIRTGELLK